MYKMGKSRFVFASKNGQKAKGSEHALKQHLKFCLLSLIHTYNCGLYAINNYQSEKIMSPSSHQLREVSHKFSQCAY